MMLRFQELTVLLALFVQAALGPPAGAEAPAADYAALWQATRDVRLEPDLAVEVENLRFDTGMAVLHIEKGTFFPASPVGELRAEMVFLGRARLTLEPPDEVEAGQLDLFTGSRRLDEEITEAALVITRDAAVRAIFGRPLARDVGEAPRRRAAELFASWRERPERRLLGVESAVFRDALGEAATEGYFAGWFKGRELGELLYLVEPDAPEQVTLGRFTKLETTEKEARKIARVLHRAQRKGRLVGLSAEHLGTWDTWLSASRRNLEGVATPGRQGFEPRHYELEVALSGRELELSGRARLHLTAMTGKARVVKLEIHSDLVVRRATTGDGQELFFQQSGAEMSDQLAEVLVVLPRAPAQGTETVVELEYSGSAIAKVRSKSFALVNTTHWYPHAGTIDRATYDVTLRWPETVELVTGGRLVDSGNHGGQRFERRQIELPTFGVSFEVGKFRITHGQAGDVRVTLAADALLTWSQDKNSRRELLATVCDALEYFEETFGDFPLDELTVVTSPRGFSQSLLGFVTLSALSMSEDGWFARYLGLEDRRTVVAHELAHQWWGHMVPWQDYRDQWISEAMANYAAVLYARQRKLRVRGPTYGWKRILTHSLDDGRPLESVGPLVLGERLASSRSVVAYEAIVYQKGAVVLDMLARGFHEEDFQQILRQLVAAVSFRPISTESFLRLIERISGTDLDGFARQFIYGTGLPQVYYSYQLEPTAKGTWRVHVVTRQQSPFRYRFEVVDRGGTLDIARHRLDQAELADSALFVPFQIAAFDPDVKLEKRKGFDPRVEGNVTVIGRMVVHGRSSAFDMEIEHEPKELWLDRDGEVFGLFFNERRHPKRMLFFRGYNQAAAGEHAAAEDLYRRALTAEVFSGPRSGDDADSDEIEQEGTRLDAWILLRLADLYLDQDRKADARATFDRLEKDMSRQLRQELKSARWYLEARLAIREGEPDRAWELLNKKALRRSVRHDPEGLLLLAIAARQTGRGEECATAMASAKEKGADVGVLEEGAPRS